MECVVTSIISSAATSPRLTILQSELTSQVSAGTISAADESSLSSALSSIDQSLGSSNQWSSSPQEMKGKIGALIDQQVSDGTLTSAQGDELKNVFASAAPGQNGAPSDSASTADSASQSEALSSFLKTLQDGWDQSGYNSNGQTTSNNSGSLLLNYTT
jgi:hypothetical protein